MFSDVKQGKLREAIKTVKRMNKAMQDLISLWTAGEAAKAEPTQANRADEASSLAMLLSAAVRSNAAVTESSKAAIALGKYDIEIEALTGAIPELLSLERYERRALSRRRRAIRRFDAFGD
jgi:hypothetical protein